MVVAHPRQHSCNLSALKHGDFLFERRPQPPITVQQQDPPLPAQRAAARSSRTFPGSLVTAMLRYAMVGPYWLPMAAIRITMCRIADETLDEVPLPARYFHLSCWWFALGWPAYIGVRAIFWLMIAKPDISKRPPSGVLRHFGSALMDLR
ncbi:DUF2269 family protein [Novosphingobium sp. BL-8A]|uniref:DUF2269 family protein n=1 Tax=Novosphingobium sp. BL-8A TaxID=3127639 RepID=UPI0037566481